MSTSQRLGRILLNVRPGFLAAWLKTLLRVHRFPHPTPHGVFWVDPASYFGLTLLEQGEYEPAMRVILESALKPGDTFVDLGANEGYFSVLGARLVGPSGRVLAIEPQARLQPVIKENLRLNSCANTTVAHVAISDHQGAASIHLAPSTNNGATSLRRPTRYAVSTETVLLATLAEVLDTHGVSSVQLLKIDIEGWEHEAIHGSEALFRSGRIRAIVLEVHPHLLAARGLGDGDELIAFLADCGYRQRDTRDGGFYLALPE